MFNLWANGLSVSRVACLCSGCLYVYVFYLVTLHHYLIRFYDR